MGYLVRRCFPTQAAEMAPMMKSTVMTKSALTAALAESCEVKKGVISTALSTLASIATQEVFGKVVMVKAKPAKTVVKAFPARPSRTSSEGLRVCGEPREEAPRVLLQFLLLLYLRAILCWLAGGRVVMHGLPVPGPRTPSLGDHMYSTSVSPR